MSFRLFAVIFVFTAIGCSKIDVEGEQLPSLHGLTPENMVTNLPVFNVSADSLKFYKMVVNPTAKKFVEAQLTYWDEKHQEVFTNVMAVMEIKGKSSSYNPMKSLGLKFYSPLDNQTHNVLNPSKVLAHHSLQNLDAVRFRNSGNDFGQTMLKDICYTQLAINADVDFELMYYRQAHIFVNHQYYGLVNLRTENNLYGMTGLNSVDSTQISLMKIDVDNGNLEWDEGTTDMASIFIKALEEEDAATLWSIIDESSFLDYILFQDYIGNFDWPHNNTRMYSVKGAPFRFILYDLDFSAFNNSNPILPEMEYRNDDLSKLYREMRKKAGFDNRLKQRQIELYQKLSPDAFNRIIDANTRIIEEEIPYFLAKYNRPQSMLQWRRNLDLMRREFRMRDKSIRDKYDL